MAFLKNKFSYGQYLRIWKKNWKLSLSRSNTFIQVSLWHMAQTFMAQLWHKQLP